MFTGITRGTFPVVDLERRPDLLRYTVELPTELAQGVQLGASVSIDGVCQTVVAIDDADSTGDGRRLTFDAIVETLDKTTLGELEVGTLVSVERSMRAGDEIGGHEVAGHVHGTGTIGEIRRAGDEVALRIDVQADWLPYIQHKGFIAVDGSSLTVGEVLGPDQADVDGHGAFWIYLIPETLRLTRFSDKAVGDRVNVELEARTVTLVDAIERQVATRLDALLDPEHGALRETLRQLVRSELGS